ncbi:hypothetical protein SAMN05421781_0785 [Marinococcus luteus]|uniref:Uncharacterized protein n=1 Tax=Marinococcus luteus TaxID=1122204 RepID=A0A1H2RI61_9BACI|nr:hypothetical protein [Marinococcus luteus]SDW19153.1 hypothetical protein SAMN05421781_0785 [Marinococcus luteus]
MIDFLIIGGGIVGMALAHELSPLPGTSGGSGKRTYERRRTVVTVFCLKGWGVVMKVLVTGFTGKVGF